MRGSDHPPSQRPPNAQKPCPTAPVSGCWGRPLGRNLGWTTSSMSLSTAALPPATVRSTTECHSTISATASLFRRPVTRSCTAATEFAWRGHMALSLAMPRDAKTMHPSSFLCSRTPYSSHRKSVHSLGCADTRSVSHRWNTYLGTVMWQAFKSTYLGICHVIPWLSTASRNAQGPNTARQLAVLDLWLSRHQSCCIAGLGMISARPACTR